ncbi:MAG: hypothetical protein J3K34DRAFT_502100 [Monoraphidium minutum]|nr:MAG: hypothetical protein J3K34DRAFT_502100 [Monoraphidium minutum]
MGAAADGAPSAGAAGNGAPQGRQLHSTRSQSMPRISVGTGAGSFGGAAPGGPQQQQPSSAAARAALQQPSFGQQLAQSLQLDACDSPPPPPPGGAGARADERFARAARLVADVCAAVREMAAAANRARTFREQCSGALGAALAASLALQEALAAAAAPGAHPALLLRAGGEVQVAVSRAQGLVRKYGRQALLESLMRRSSREEVVAKFDEVVATLNALEDGLWASIDPQNKLRRELRPPPPPRGPTSPRAGSGGGGAPGAPPLTGAGSLRGAGSLPPPPPPARGSHRLAWRALRRASQHKIEGLLWFPEPDGDGGCDGCVAWGAHQGLKVVNLSSNVTTMIAGGAGGLTAFAYSAAGFLWSGHDDGTLRAWSLDAADAAAPPLRAADRGVSALAVDEDSGYVWAGTTAGEVVIVRHKRDGDGGRGRLDVVRTLLGFDAHSPRVGSGSGGGAAQLPAPPYASPLLAQGSGAPASSGGGAAALLGGGDSGGAGGGGARRGGSRRGGGAGLMGSLELLEHCFTGGPGGSRRLRDSAVHAGPVAAIVIAGGRAFTAGGKSKGSSALLVWDTASCELLRTVTRRSTQWLRSPVTALCPVLWGRIGCGSAGGADMHIVVMWDPTGDTLRPVLAVGQERGPVRSLGVLEELGLLAAGHANGKVHLRKLDPKTRLPPRGDAHVSLWAPHTLTLPAHRLGLAGMAAGGHLVVTAGASGSVKLTPEAALRVAAADAGLRLPHGASVIAEALTTLLLGGGGGSGSAAAAAVLLSAGSGSSVGGLLSQYSSLHHSASASASAGQLQALLSISEASARHHAPPAGGARGGSSSGGSRAQAAAQATPSLQSSGGGVARALSPLSGPPSSQQQQQQQPSRTASGSAGGAAADPGPQPESSGGGAAAAAAAPRAPPWGLSRQPSGSWPQQQQLAVDSPWILRYGDLRLGRVLGEGSYGRVRIGWWRETEVAVKILYSPGGGGAGATHEAGPAASAAPDDGGGDEASWDERRLRALSKEVDILANLRHPNVVMFLGVCLRPPCVVTEYCSLGSLYDVLRRARRDAAFGARLTWTRRLLMALDAAKGMLYLHSHEPVAILHRDLKSPNLLVAKDWTVQVGDFNLSRYMSRDRAFIKSSLENNPRWSAPEVITEGRYSKEADVYSFGVVLWELLTWEEPWDREQLNSYQIMTALSQGQRPEVPPAGEMPGQLGPAAAAADFVRLMEECWDGVPSARPTFQDVICRLKAMLLTNRAAAGPGPPRSESTSRILPPPPNGAAPPPGAPGAGAPAPGQPPPAPRAPAGGRHRRSVSEAAALAPLQGPGPTDGAIADLLNLEEDGGGGGGRRGGEGPPGPPDLLSGDGGGGAHAAAFPPIVGPPPRAGPAAPRVSPFAAAAFPSAAAAAAAGAFSPEASAAAASGVADGGLPLTPPLGSRAASRAASGAAAAAGGGPARGGAAGAADDAPLVRLDSDPQEPQQPHAAAVPPPPPRGGPWPSPFAAPQEQGRAWGAAGGGAPERGAAPPLAVPVSSRAMVAPPVAPAPLVSPFAAVT